LRNRLRKMKLPKKILIILQIEMFERHENFNGAYIRVIMNQMCDDLIIGL
jgi:hypothetical protein